jgi:menaquinone-specific isochorismate synthase
MLCQSPFAGFNFSQDCKQLYQFLDFCRRKSIEDHQTKIASVFLEIESIDPLTVLEQWGDPNQLHFYFENRDRGWAIAAINSVVSFETSGAHRFAEVQQFIQKSLGQLIASNSIDLPWAIPRFFCSFTFFDQPLQSHPTFAPATVFLPQWQVIRWHDRAGVLANLLIQPQSNLEDLAESVWHQLQAISATQSSLLSFPYQISDLLKHWQITDTAPFQAAVASALLEIQQQRFNKLVLAHAIDVTSRLPFQAERSLHNLRQRYPDCYVFSVGNGKGQSMIGASPERLLSVHNQRLVTDALAGSAPRGQTGAEDQQLAQQLLTSDKEQREHRLVVDFITQRLATLGLVPHYTAVPTLLQLSNIQHLHTPIHATFLPEQHPLEILAELHPTPAVAGMPRAIACQQIRKYEQFERSLYAAPLGWVDAQGNAEFIVGIRSALLKGNHARLYAGAGIVAGSDPLRELAEVRLKLQALLQALV